MASRRKQPTPQPDLIHALRERGLQRYPGAHLKSPWPGHLDLAVKDKTFAYLSAPGDPPGLSLKLPFSGPLALTLPDAEPTPYGLGKSGWVSISFAQHAPPPPAQLEQWLDESYRAQAPKKLLALFEASLDGSAPPTKASKGASRALATTAAKANAKANGKSKPTPGKATTGPATTRPRAQADTAATTQSAKPKRPRAKPARNGPGRARLPNRPQ